MNLSIKRLRAFVTVASLQSFTEAANRLHITQSALSALVKELEREVEIPLFSRTTRSVELTPAGRKFLPHAEQATVSYNDAIHGAKSLTRRPRNTVTLRAPQLTPARAAHSDDRAMCRPERGTSRSLMWPDRWRLGDHRLARHEPTMGTFAVSRRCRASGEWLIPVR